MSKREAAKKMEELAKKITAKPVRGKKETVQDLLNRIRYAPSSR